jgi:hypothetical protein
MFRFADCDMFMCFTGGGIGHLATRQSTQSFQDEIRRVWGNSGDLSRCEMEEGEPERLVEHENDDSVVGGAEDSRFMSEEAFQGEDNSDWGSEQDNDSCASVDDGDSCIEDEFTLGFNVL